MISAILTELAKADDSLGRDTADAAAISTSLRDNTTATQLTVAGLGLVSGLFLAFFIGRSIAGPITGMTTAMGTLAAGNHDVAIPGANGSDEISDMARAVEVFRTNMISAERLAVEQETTQAARSRRQEAMDRHTLAFGDSVTGVMTALAKAAGNMRRAADIMTDSAASVVRRRLRPPAAPESPPPTSPRSPLPLNSLPPASGRSPARSRSLPMWQLRRRSAPRPAKPSFEASRTPPLGSAMWSA